VNTQAAQAVAQAQADTSFGLDFPNLFNPPAVSEQAQVTDPVTSGGDSASTGWTGDEDEDEHNAQ